MVRLGEETEAAAFLVVEPGGGERRRGDVRTSEHDPAKHDNGLFSSSRLRGEARLRGEEALGSAQHDDRNACGSARKDGSKSGVLGIQEPGGFNTKSGDADAGLEGSAGIGQEMSITTRSRAATAAWREFVVPIRLLQEKRVRAILFVYGIYSVSTRRKIASPVVRVENEGSIGVLSWASSLFDMTVFCLSGSLLRWGGERRDVTINLRLSKHAES